MKIELRSHIWIIDVELFETSLILNIFSIIIKLFAVWIYKVLVYFYRVLQSVPKEYWRVNIKSFYFLHTWQLSIPFFDETYRLESKANKQLR
jgi:uncharacterized protein YggT (Ycf19 family)